MTYVYGGSGKKLYHCLCGQSFDDKKNFFEHIWGKNSEVHSLLGISDKTVPRNFQIGMLQNISAAQRRKKYRM